MERAMSNIEGFIDGTDVYRSGIYALTYQGVVVYIGQSISMIDRIFVHYTGQGKLTSRNTKRYRRGMRFDGLFIKRCRVEELDTVEKGLIQKYNPKYNTLFNRFLKKPPQIENILKRLVPKVEEPKIAIPRRGL
jgi:excinuclease UvrABC nuclease subunit